ncbi:hypothetical protein ABVN18_05765 [Pseudomonas canadensis]|uniref:hypothetical protein n=1 Tax=Pseudomonas canadensis TaxID=915099 RepID=UPI00336AC09F
MSGAPIVPDNVEGNRVSVSQQVIRTIDCPNSDCNQTLNITELSAGAKIKCPSCKNYTWAPEYKSRWWQKLRNFSVAIVVSFVVGILSSLAAPTVSDFFGRIKIVDSKENKESTKNYGESVK